jgi:hypothetical protein
MFQYFLDKSQRAIYNLMTWVCEVIFQKIYNTLLTRDIYFLIIDKVDKTKLKKSLISSTWFF